MKVKKKAKSAFFSPGSGLGGLVVFWYYHIRFLDPKNTQKWQKPKIRFFQKLSVLWSDTILVVKNEISDPFLVVKYVLSKIRDKKI